MRGWQVRLSADGLFASQAMRLRRRLAPHILAFVSSQCDFETFAPLSQASPFRHRLERKAARR
jgi:hypothetical protein